MFKTFRFAVPVTIFAILTGCGQAPNQAVDQAAEGQGNTPAALTPVRNEDFGEIDPANISDALVQRVHHAALLIDTHNDVPWIVVDGFDIGQRSTEWQTDLPRLREGGVGALFFSVYVGRSYVPEGDAAHRALDIIDAVRHGVVERYPDDFQLATSVAEIEDARANGKIAALMGLEGGHAIENDLGVLRDFYDLGIRYMTLTHSNTNDWADSSGTAMDPGAERHGGLTEFGKDVVREMNRLGMLVDISHVADDTFWDALEVSSAPLIASHSSARAVTAHPRNLTDEMLVALAEKGGVVQVNFNCGFVSDTFRAAQDEDNAAVEAEYERRRAGRALSEEATDQMYYEIRRDLGTTRASLEDLMAHFDHIRDVAGVDAMGIGSDFNGVTCTPEGLDDVSQFPNLTRALLEHGYSPEDIAKIYGGNLMRVMVEVEGVAHR